LSDDDALRIPFDHLAHGGDKLWSSLRERRTQVARGAAVRILNAACPGQKANEWRLDLLGQNAPNRMTGPSAIQTLSATGLRVLSGG
jgi:hypothetical protein